MNAYQIYTDLIYLKLNKRIKTLIAIVENTFFIVKCFHLSV